MEAHLENDDEDYILDIFKGESLEPHGRSHDVVCYGHNFFYKGAINKTNK